MLRNYFNFVVRHPLKVTFVMLAFIAAVGFGATKIVKDTTADAFIAKDHPALVNKKRLTKLFGLTDPVVMVVENKQGIFNPETLSLVYKLSEEIQQFKEVKNDGITSLSTKKNIKGVSDGMEVEYFVPQKQMTPKLAQKAKDAIAQFPLMQGTLVSKDGKATLIIADTQGQKQETGEALYKKMVSLAKKEQSKHIRLYVAGEGAVSGYMGSYIDADASRLNPVAAIVIMIVLFIAFRRVGAVLLPNLVILGAVATALGAMGHSGVAFFVITNAMPVVLIGISVADSIHILSTYYERRRDYPEESSAQAVVETMLEMWRPIGLTTLTTMAGFLGLALASTMPPMHYFGIFALIGVGAAWVYSVTILPALMAKFQLKPSPLFLKKERTHNQMAQKIATLVASHPKAIIISLLLISLLALLGARLLIINEDRITTFSSDEPIVKADHVINNRFNGSHYFDVLVDSHKEEGLFSPKLMQKIAAFEKFVVTLPHVKGAVAYTDYLKQMNKALDENRQSSYRLPSSADAAAQYFLLYNARASSDDFEQILDYNYQKANIRVYLDSGEYINEKPVLLKMQRYIKEHFSPSLADVQISGRANVDYYWYHGIEKSHFRSIAISLALVFLMALASFRSFKLALLVTVPVVLAVIMIYGVMGVTGIWLGVGTSMFASIAIGLGVDFAVHTAERMESLKSSAKSATEHLYALYASTGRALFFNALALALGFGVLMVSKVVPLFKFGSLVAVAITSSFLFSLLLIPAAMVLLNRKSYTKDQS